MFFIHMDYLNFQQDIVHEVYRGDGFPDCALTIDLFHGNPRTCKTKSWNYYLSNTEEYKDNWNLENFSLLGPTRIARHSEPVILFFDLKTKYGGVILKSPIVEYTIIYISDKIQYNRTFKVWIPGYN